VSAFETAIQAAFDRAGLPYTQKARNALTMLADTMYRRGVVAGLRALGDVPDEYREMIVVNHQDIAEVIAFLQDGRKIEDLDVTEKGVYYRLLEARDGDV
jgi:hypothetical protein